MSYSFRKKQSLIEMTPPTCPVQGSSRSNNTCTMQGSNSSSTVQVSNSKCPVQGSNITSAVHGSNSKCPVQGLNSTSAVHNNSLKQGGSNPTSVIAQGLNSICTVPACSTVPGSIHAVKGGGNLAKVPGSSTGGNLTKVPGSASHNNDQVKQENDKQKF